MVKLYVINGIATCGKDTFVKKVSEKIPNVENIDSVALHKQTLSILGWDGKKDDKSRELLSYLKQKTDEYYNTSLNYIKDSIKCSDYDVYFIHVREHKNIKLLLDYYSVFKDMEIKSLYVSRDSVVEEFTNESDKEAKKTFPYDITIENNKDLEHLDKCVDDFIATEKLK